MGSACSEGGGIQGGPRLSHPESWRRCPAWAEPASGMLAETPAGLFMRLWGGGASKERVPRDSASPEPRCAPRPPGSLLFTFIPFLLCLFPSPAAKSRLQLGGSILGTSLG